jgi:hypothetical protein
VGRKRPTHREDDIANIKSRFVSDRSCIRDVVFSVCAEGANSMQVLCGEIVFGGLLSHTLLFEIF